MATPSTKTIKRLFALSSNRCAFPKCTTKIIEDQIGKVIGEICHIKANKPDGPRYDKEQPDEERHGFDNLVLLCPNHHTVVDSDIDSYTVERLKKMKSDNEELSEKEIDYPEFLMKSLIHKMEVKKIGSSNIIGEQKANVIQNITHSIGAEKEKDLNYLLTVLHSRETLSNAITQILEWANNNKDEDLIKLCSNELNEYEEPPNLTDHYRLAEVFISPYPIKSVTGLDNEGFWKEMESNKNFVKKNMFMTQSVPEIEQDINRNPELNTQKSYITMRRKFKDLNPEAQAPDLDVYIYGKGYMNHDLLNRIRNNLVTEILIRIK